MFINNNALMNITINRFTSFCEILYSFGCYKVTAIINCYNLSLNCISAKTIKMICQLLNNHEIKCTLLMMFASKAVTRSIVSKKRLIHNCLF